MTDRTSRNQQNTAKGNYKILDFYMIRSTLYPVETFFSLASHSDLKDHNQSILIQSSNDPIVKEAIATASLSLLNELPHLDQQMKVKKKDQVLSSLFKYITRMSTRPTPFGLFSGVAYGEWGDHTALTMESPAQHQKMIRPDMEWMTKLIQVLENDQELAAQLKVRVNPLVYQVGSRVKLPFITMDAQDEHIIDQKQAYTIKGSSLLQDVFEFSEEFIEFQALIHKITERNPDYPKDMVEQYLWQLLKREYLLSELRPPLLDFSPIDYVIEKIAGLAGAEHIAALLRDLKQRISQYSAISIGQGEKEFTRLVEFMKSIVEVKNPLQVDLKLEFERRPVLNELVKQEAERAAEFFGRLSASKHTYPHLKSYRTEFMEKYGVNREVPLLTLLDEDLGLGAPAFYKWPRSTKRGEADVTATNTNEHVISQWAMEAIVNQTYEIELDETKLNQLFSEEDKPEQLPPSFDLIFSIHAPSANSLDQGDFELVMGGAPGSSRAGQFFGRFMGMMDEGLEKKFADIHRYEQQLHEERIFAEVVYLPFANRNANVVLTKKTRPYEITLGTTPSGPSEQSISLKDLVVGCTNDYFYLKSKSLNKEVIPTFSHMLNYVNTPNIYRFLYEVTLERGGALLPFHWGSFETMPVRPRLKLGRTILSPAQWRLSKVSMEVNQYEEWYDRFEQWRQQYRVPKYVYLTFGDNRLLLDLDERIHVREIQRALKGNENEFVILTEAGSEAAQFWIKNKTGQHFNAEFVFPVVKQPLITNGSQSRKESSRSGVFQQQGAHPLPTDQERVYFPGSEWLYLKLYCSHLREGEFLERLGDFCAEMEQKGLTEKSFFIRYKDTEHHIRLRFYGDPNVLSGQLLPLLRAWLEERHKEVLVTRVVIDSYDPEIERYGGIDVIHLAEELFWIDSKCVYQWIKLLRNKKLTLTPVMLGVINVIHILESFQIPFASQLDYLNSITAYNQHNEEFRSSRETFMLLGNSDNEWENLRQTDNGVLLFPALQLRAKGIQAYHQGLKQAEQSGSLVTPIEQIVQSVIHMHINRLIGIKREEEIKILTLARHTLHNLRYLKSKELSRS